MPELAAIEVALVLQTVDIFSFCRAEQVLLIAGIAEERSCAPGERIYAQREPPHHLYSVVRGEIELRSAAGVRRVGPLGSFGAVEIFADRPRDEEATAVGESLLLAISSEDLFDLLSLNIEIVKPIFRHLLVLLEDPDRQEAP